jgi:cell division protein FtsB
MKQAKRLLNLLRSAMWPAMALTIIAFFGGYALFGSNGVLAWGDYNQKFESRSIELAAISKRRNELAHRVTLLDPRHANPDLVDELVRKELGLTQPDEVIIPLN